jgi:glycosyltransferase involved in cell wall biosynthesis
MSLTPRTSLVVPVQDEEENVDELLTRLSRVFEEAELSGEVIFVDDSNGPETGAAIREAQARLTCHNLTISHVHRPPPERTGLATAVVLGFGEARSQRVLVMDGDLQHEPEKVPAILAELDGGADLVAASRYMPGGSAEGLDGPIRKIVSIVSTMAAKALFGRKLSGMTDPMTGFFAVRLDKIDIERLENTRGFKILLQMRVHHPDLTYAEVPLQFKARRAGNSKGTIRQGIEFGRQLAELRIATLPMSIKRMANFAFGGGLIALLGAVMLAGMVKLGTTAAAAYATQLVVTWGLNFWYNYRWTWRDLPREGMVSKMVWFAVTRGATQVVSWFAFEWLLHYGVGHNLAYWPCLFAAMAVNYITSDKLVFTNGSRRKLMNQISWRKAAIYAAVIAAMVILAAGIYKYGLRMSADVALFLIAVFCFTLGAIETRWRLYSFWTPEMMSSFAWPNPVSVVWAAKQFHTLIPALNEADHIGPTIDQVMMQDHPHHEVVVSLCDCDTATINATKTAAARYPGHVRLVIGRHGRHRKARQLNRVLATIPVDTKNVVVVVDAEGGIRPTLLRHMEAVYNATGCDVVQGGVQLMNLLRWFQVFAAMEYKAWFEGNMARQAKTGVVLFGGNTIAFTTAHLARIGGFPDSLTEDGVAGIRSAMVGAKVAVCYSPALCTRELSPPTIFNKEMGSLFWQRVRWVQGYLEELLGGKWLQLPTRGQRVSAGYGLAAPVLQAVCSVLLPVAIASALYLKVPDLLSFGTFTPLGVYFLTVVAQMMHLADFGRRFEKKVKFRHYAILFVMSPVYQMILMGAAAMAVWRHFTDRGDWYKTARRHTNNENVLVTLEGASA